MLELAIILNMKQKKIMLFKLQKNGDFKKIYAKQGTWDFY